MTAKKSPRELAVAVVEEQQGVVARWEAELAAKTAELRDLQERAGEEVLADESAADGLMRSMQELRDRIDIASRAVAAASPKLHAAAVAVVLAEADEWDAVRTRRQVLVDEFDAQQQVLLDALEEFTGLPWAVRQYNEGVGVTVVSSNDGATRIVNRSPRARLVEACQVAERTAWCLREIAEGRDPHRALSEPLDGPLLRGLVNGPPASMFYTDSVWGPTAVLPAPAYLRQVEAAAVREPVSTGDAVG